MTKLLIGNDFIDEIRSDDASTGWWVQRIAWFAEHGDVLVLGEPPDWDFLRYVGRMLRVEPRSWTVVVVQDYLPGTAEVSGETLLHPDVVAALRTAVERAGVDRMVPVWPDPAVGVLAEILGLEHALPGYGFIRQSGGRYGSSKALFRAAAAGCGVPIAPGAICTTRTDMIREARRLLEQYGVVMFKHELIQAGRGNEIVSLGKRVQPIGAPRVVELSHGSEVDAYVAQRWDWLSSGGRARSIVERYYPGSTTLIAEFECTDEGVRFDCDGELLLAPLMAGQVLPAQDLEDSVRADLFDGADRLAHALQALGYRGTVSPDAIVNDHREVIFTEWNARITGSTHLHAGIGRRVVGDAFGKDRLVMERLWPSGWSVTSFSDASQRLESSGLAYDDRSREGVVLNTAFDGRGGLIYSVVAEDVDRSYDLDRSLKNVFGR